MTKLKVSRWETFASQIESKQTVDIVVTCVKHKEKNRLIVQNSHILKLTEAKFC